MAEPMAGGETTDALAGVVAMLTSPLLSTVGLTLWERWAGSAVALNLVKCSFGTCLFLLVLASEAAAGPPVLPTASDAWWLTGSSVLGIVLGDVMWLSAFQILGTRAVVLLGTLQPLLAMLAGAALFGQPMTSTPYTTLGVFTTCAGLALAALGNPRKKAESETDALPTHDPPGSLGAAGPALAALGDPTKVAEFDTSALAIIADVAPHTTCSTPLPEPSTHPRVLEGALEDPRAAGLARRRATRRRLLLGGAFAVGNVAFDVAGAVITRAHGVGLSTWTINAIRFGAASVITAVVMQGARAFNSMRGGRLPPKWATLPEQTRRAWALILLGVCLVTFLAPALNAFGLFCMPLGAWTALGALGPVYAVPVLWVLRGEVMPPCGLAGAALAAGGAVVMSLSVRRNV